jgi:hypothetical protein
MGKKADPSKKDGEEHVSRPLAALKDPASFGPPPKNVNYHGGAALPNEITPQTSGWGAPLSPQQIADANRAANGPTQEEVEEEARRAGPPLPYRADRTGLKTDHLPPPPLHRDVVRGPEVAEPAPNRPQPRLPPRLPSRQSTTPTPTPPPVAAPAISSPPIISPPAYDALPVSNSYKSINQAAVNRLGNAGVSVPALGIGSDQSSNPWRSEQSHAKASPVTSQPVNNQVSELQARFARMNSAASTTSQQNTTPPFVTPLQSPAPASGQADYIQPAPPQTHTQPQGTTWAEKQAALRTAQNAYKDPSTVTAADATSAARTANSFRERHKDTIDAAGSRASELNKKYNVTGRLNSFLEKHSSPTSETPPAGVSGNPALGQQQMPANAQITPQQSHSPEITASLSRKPPPPPPPKKPANMHGSVGGMSVSPPPVPLGTKPSYS